MIKTRCQWRDEMPVLEDEELPDEESFQDSVRVTVELVAEVGESNSSFGDSRDADESTDSEVSWNGIPEGTYEIAASVPEGYRIASYWRQVGDGDWEQLIEQVSVNANVVADSTTTVWLQLMPLLAAIEVRPFYDRDGSGDPTHANQNPFTVAGVEFRIQGKPITLVRLSEMTFENIEPLLGSSLARMLEHHRYPSDVYLFWKSGNVNVLTEAAVKWTQSGDCAMSLQLQSAGGTLVAAQRGVLAVANIAYDQSFAAIQISAMLEQDEPCDPCSGQNFRTRKKLTPLPNVSFQLYLGSAKGEPYRQATTSGSAPHVFSNLPASNYYILATDWPKSYSGLSQIQPRSSQLLGPQSVSAGVITPVEFRFAPCLGRVTGIVTEGQTGVGVPNVPVTLTSKNGSLNSNLLATSSANGEYQFSNVAAGSYLVQIEREKVYLPGGKTLEVPADAQAGYPVEVPACKTVLGPVITLNEDLHKIFGTATSPDGSILRYLRIEIQDKNGNKVAVTQTDANGDYSVILPQAGYYVVVPQINGGQQIPVQINSEERVDILAAQGGAPASPSAASTAAQVAEAEIDLQAYPVLTEEVPTDVVLRPPSGGGGYGSAPIGKMAENAIRDVLSWRAKANDPKSFILALNQSFALKDVEGHTEFTWTPRTYTVQTDMGAITGAQASIYNRAKVALDQSLPLLDGLYALLPSLEQEDLNSVRELVRSLFTELVNDFGIEGGPRVPRVNQLFRLLLGHPLPTNPEQAGGQLGTLRERFGLKREYVTTIADEQNLTNYIILVDYVIGLGNSWNTQKAYFARSGQGSAEPFFGTQLVLLSRALDVVAQSVKDVYFAMDSVFLGAAERQTILLDFTSIGEESSMYVAELLDWVDSAASKELPRQLQDSGKDAIDTMKHVIHTLHRFVHAAVHSQQPLKGLPPGYRTPRVQRAMRELANQLKETYNLANQVKSPNFPD